MDTPEFLTLKNGVKVGEPQLTTASLTLTDLFKSGISGMLAVADLNKAARIENEKVTDKKTLEMLHNLGLVLEDGSIHDEIRQIVINSIEGEGLKMHLTSPLPPKPYSV